MPINFSKTQEKMVMKYRLKRGTHVIFNGREHSIEKRLPSGELQLKDIAINEFKTILEQELIDAVYDGDAEIIGEAQEHTKLKAKQEKTLVYDFPSLEETDPRKMEALRRFAYIKAIINQNITGLTDENITPVVKQISQLIDDSNPPSCASIRRWYIDFVSSGEDIRSLIPSIKARGNRNRKICKDKLKCEAVLRIIENVISEEYLSIQRPTAQSCYGTVVARITEDNRLRPSDNQLPIPHKSTVYKIVKKLDPYEKDKARYGKRIADLKHRVNKRGARPTRPLERVECDDTKLDIFVIDPVTLMPLGRPWLITLIDVYTKMILGFYLSFVPPSYLSVMQCLLHAIKPKKYVKEKYPKIKNKWAVYGIMEMLVVDNAKHWHSKSFEEACLQIGTIVQYAPPRTPWYKPSIERFFKTLNLTLLHQLPGTTFSNIIEKGDYNPKENAIISIDFLEESFHHWIIDIYQNSHHRGIDDVPARLWEVGIAKYPPAIPTSKTELDVLIGHVASRVISASGIEIFGLFYNDETLAAIRGELKTSKKVKIKFNPSDISIIYVYDKQNGRYLTVPCTDQDYAKGLTLWQHTLIRKLARKRNNGEVNIIELCLAKEYLKERVKLYCANVKEKRTNMKIARWTNSETENSRASLNSFTEEDNLLASNQIEISVNGEDIQSSSNSNSVSEIGNSLENIIAPSKIIQDAKLIEITDTPKPKSKKKSLNGKYKKQTRISKPINPLTNLEVETAAIKDVNSTVEIEQCSNDELEDKELDMEGWESNYDLPK